jgi:pyrroloquinoline quinone biosynthesis protein B
MAGFLTSNGPWSQLVSRKNIDLRALKPDSSIRLEGGVMVTPFLVPHRDEFTDTVGYLIQREGHRALFIPDIDQWSRWSVQPEGAGRHGRTGVFGRDLRLGR